jgi:hypothetical protein
MHIHYGQEGITPALESHVSLFVRLGHALKCANSGACFLSITMHLHQVSPTCGTKSWSEWTSQTTLVEMAVELRVRSEERSGLMGAESSTLARSTQECLDIIAAEVIDLEAHLGSSLSN